MARVAGLLGRSVPLPQWETIIEQLPHLLVASPEEVEVGVLSLVLMQMKGGMKEGKVILPT